MQNKIQEIFYCFFTADIYIKHEALKKGHINDSYVVTGESGKRYLMQKVNEKVFKDRNKLSFNLQLLDERLRPQFNEHPQYKFPAIYNSISNQRIYSKRKGYSWRLYDFIEDSVTFDLPETSEVAYEGARALGDFQSRLNEYNPVMFYTTIMSFRNLNMRVRALKSSIRRDVSKRRIAVNDLINLAIKYNTISEDNHKLIQSRSIKKRITHNDPKLNNVLFDKNTTRAVAVVDYDTIMQGNVIFDFGDIVRSFTTTVEEDSDQYDIIEVREEIFEAIINGYIAPVNDQLTSQEKNNLLQGAKSIIYMQAIRFLTDYLNGDIYYKTDYDEHNQVRCRNQFALLESLIGKEEKLNKIINKHLI